MAAEAAHVDALDAPDLRLAVENDLITPPKADYTDTTDSTVPAEPANGHAPTSKDSVVAGADAATSASDDPAKAPASDVLHVRYDLSLAGYDCGMTGRGGHGACGVGQE